MEEALILLVSPWPILTLFEANFRFWFVSNEWLFRPHHFILSQERPSSYKLKSTRKIMPFAVIIILAFSYMYVYCSVLSIHTADVKEIFVLSYILLGLCHVSFLILIHYAWIQWSLLVVKSLSLYGLSLKVLSDLQQMIPTDTT